MHTLGCHALSHACAPFCPVFVCARQACRFRSSLIFRKILCEKLRFSHLQRSRSHLSVPLSSQTTTTHKLWLFLLARSVGVTNVLHSRPRVLPFMSTCSHVRILREKANGTPFFPPSSQVVHIQAGQCGNQMGTKFWEVRG